MEIDKKDIFDIIDKAKRNFVDQSPRMYWKTSQGKKEITFEEKKIIAMIEAVNSIKQLGLEIEYGE